MSIKILHTADVHLGLSFRNHPEAQETLINARYETLQNVVNRANDLKVNVLAIVGDLFDKTSIKPGDIQKAISAVNQFGGEVALILPGNHDFITAESQLWERMKKEAKEHVLILDKKEPLYLSDYNLDAVVYPGPCHAKHSSENAIGWVKEVPKDEKYIHIGIAHGSLEGISPDFDQRYFPMTMNELKNSGVDIWLMGHTHITYPEKPGSRDIIFNPGTPEPDGFDCRHEGRAFLHTIDEHKKITTEILSTGSFRFIAQSENIGSPQDVDKLINKYSQDAWSKTVLSLFVSGQLDQDAYDEWQKEKNKLRNGVLELRLDDTGVRRKINPDVIRKEFVEGSFPEKLLSSFSEDEADELQMAYELIKEVQE
jgi:DNA repair protein SbcD/Mre11